MKTFALALAACSSCRPHLAFLSSVIEYALMPALGISRGMGQWAENTLSNYSGWMFPIMQLNQSPNDSFHRHLGNYKTQLFTSGDENAWEQPGWGVGVVVGKSWSRKPGWSEWKDRDENAQSEDGVGYVVKFNWQLLLMVLFSKTIIFSDSVPKQTNHWCLSLVNHLQLMWQNREKQW